MQRSKDEDSVMLPFLGAEGCFKEIINIKSSGNL